MNIEMFSCAGGMAEGFRRARLEFDHVFDWDENAVASYEANLGRCPYRMDVRDLLRMLRSGWRPGPVDIVVADPPCVSWSRAGKRRGLDDPRDMLRETVEVVELLRPRAYLIGNVPGLEDGSSWRSLQEVLAPLARAGYCVADFACLDAADYGVPQHRVRPFWFGHRGGPCIRWPERTHGDPATLGTATIAGVAPLLPWVTCRTALDGLAVEEMGRPVRLRWREKNHADHAPSNLDVPARTMTRNSMGDGSLLVHPRHPVSSSAEPCRTLTTCKGGGAKGNVVFDPKHAPNDPDRPSKSLTASLSQNGGGAITWPWDRPSMTILADPRIPPPGHHGSSFLSSPSTSKKPKRERPRPSQGHRVGTVDESSDTITTAPPRKGSGSATTLPFPWEVPSTTVCAGTPKIAAPGEHEGYKGLSAIVLSEKAAAILQGFPPGWVFSGKTKSARWEQIGQAMPPPLAEAVAKSIVEQRLRTREERAGAPG